MWEEDFGYAHGEDVDGTGEFGEGVEEGAEGTDSLFHETDAFQNDIGVYDEEVQEHFQDAAATAEHDGVLYRGDFGEEPGFEVELGVGYEGGYEDEFGEAPQEELAEQLSEQLPDGELGVGYDGGYGGFGDDFGDALQEEFPEPLPEQPPEDMGQEDEGYFGEEIGEHVEEHFQEEFGEEAFAESRQEQGEEPQDAWSTLPDADFREYGEGGEQVTASTNMSFEAPEPTVDSTAVTDAEEGRALHLADGAEGILRLKRLLEEDVSTNTEAGNAAKKRRLEASGFEVPRPIETIKVRQLLQRWHVGDDICSKYVLESVSLSELTELLSSKWCPNMKDIKRSVAEQISACLTQNKERHGPSNGPLDAIATFKGRFKLSQEQDRQLRGLSHKELRFVLNEFDGERDLQDVISEACDVVPDFAKAADASPDTPGSQTLGRFLRLELIDPMADALVLGDANLTFSLQLAMHRKSLHHVGRIIATTFETLETLRERYHEIDGTIKELEEHGAEVWHGVDCTRIGADPRFQGLEENFGAAYYNFPHAGAVRGFFDAHPFVRWRHANLMQLFFRALRAYMKVGGSVKVSSNSNATGVRYSDIIDAAMLNEFVHVETVPFKEWHLRRYHRSFGDRRDARQRPDKDSYTSQNADKDMVYSFCYAPTGETLGQAPIKRPPDFNDLLNATCVCSCGFICQTVMRNTQYASYHFKTSGMHQNLQGEAKRKTVSDLYQRFISEISGQHVG